MAFEDYKKQAADDLRSYPHLKARAETLKRQINMLTEMDDESAAVFNRCVDPCGVSNSIEALKDELNLITFRIICVESSLSAMSDEDKELLTNFYITRQRNTVNTMARKTYTDRSCIYRRAQKALERYIYTCFGVSETM